MPSGNELLFNPIDFMQAEHIGAAIGIVTFLGGLLAWYRASVESNVSLKRDWAHLKRNQEQLIESIGFLLKELDTRFDRQDAQLIELKGMFYASLNRGGRMEERQ